MLDKYFEYRSNIVRATLSCTCVTRKDKVGVFKRIVGVVEISRRVECIWRIKRKRKRRVAWHKFVKNLGECFGAIIPVT